MATQLLAQRENILPNIGVGEKVLAGTAEVLGRLLADELITVARTTNYKYNVVNPRAHQFCYVFKEQAKQMVELEDKIAKHMRSLGYKVPNVMERLRTTRLEAPKEGHWPDAHAMLSCLIYCHENILQNICKDKDKVRDMGLRSTDDLLLEVERCHMKWAWQLRIHLERAPSAGGQ